jgi:hypothetical protein
MVAADAVLDVHHRIADACSSARSRIIASTLVARSRERLRLRRGLVS